MDWGGGLEAEPRFRQVAGYRTIPKLVAVQRAHDAALDRARQLEMRNELPKPRSSRYSIPASFQTFPNTVPSN